MGSKVKEYQALENKIKKAEGAVEEIEKRLSSNDDIAVKGETRLLELNNQIAAAVAGNRPTKEIEALEKDRADVERSIERATLGIKELGAMLEKEQQNLSALKHERDVSFNEDLSKGFLEKEIQRYDAAYDALVDSLRRIFAAQHLMRDRPDGLAVWRSCLGEANTYIGAVYVVRIKDFDVQQVRQMRSLFNPGQDILNRVEQAILSGE